MRRRYTIVTEFDDESPVFSDRQRDVIRQMTPTMREEQIAASLQCHVPNMIVLEVTEIEVVTLTLVNPNR